ncbi:MAG: YgiT-type zinc finger protein [Bryobacteraceae bacterium]|jgi:YgiT-type zinc finger domain-containing protein
MDAAKSIVNAVAMQINQCPTCGSNKIKAVKRTWHGDFAGQSYTVPNLEFHECPVCGERVYEPDALRMIQERSPAFAKRRMKRSA